MTYVDPGDIVFLTSDGISDNFDPVVGKFCVPKRAESINAATEKGGSKNSNATSNNSNNSGEKTRNSNKTVTSTNGHPNGSSLPSVAAYQRHELTLLRMEDLLNHGSGSEAAPLQQSLGISGRVQTAAELCHRMVDFCQRLTTAKRKVLEDPDLYPEVNNCLDITI